MTQEEFERGQAWAAKRQEPVFRYLATLNQGDGIELRDPGGPGERSRLLRIPLAYVGLIPRNRKYPVLCRKRLTGQLVRVAVRGIVIRDEEEEVYIRRDWL
jgi:hypothetical protein